jgi:hypothetical protein
MNVHGTASSSFHLFAFDNHEWYGCQYRLSNAYNEYIHIHLLNTEAKPWNYEY